MEILLSYLFNRTSIKIYVFLEVAGSMKTIGFLITNLLELSKYKKSMVVTDPKRRDLSHYF
jgi:type IV secretory pathway TraG/TraD family ATPase VirD4